MIPLGFKHSKETRKKMSKSHRGINTWMKGRIPSDETRKKLSLAQIRIGNRPPSRSGVKLSEETKKKIGNANRGRRHTKESKQKMSFWLGKKFSEEHLKNLKLSRIGKKPMLGHHLSDEAKRKIAEASSGRIHSPETRKKIGDAQRGEKGNNWKGGISFNPYPPEFNSVLKLKIRTRDNFTCCLCGKTEREQLDEINRVLSVNHIDFDKNNCQESNLNTLCLKCNTKICRDREYWTNYFNQLYE